MGICNCWALLLHFCCVWVFTVLCSLLSVVCCLKKHSCYIGGNAYSHKIEFAFFSNGATERVPILLFPTSSNCLSFARYGMVTLFFVVIPPKWREDEENEEKKVKSLKQNEWTSRTTEKSLTFAITSDSVFTAFSCCFSFGVRFIFNIQCSGTGAHISIKSSRVLLLRFIFYCSLFARSLFLYCILFQWF